LNSVGAEELVAFDTYGAVVVAAEESMSFVAGGGVICSVGGNVGNGVGGGVGNGVAADFSVVAGDALVAEIDVSVTVSPSLPLVSVGVSALHDSVVGKTEFESKFCTKSLKNCEL